MNVCEVSFVTVKFTMNSPGGAPGPMRYMLGDENFATTALDDWSSR